MERASTNETLPLPVKRALRKLGGDLRAARLRRRIATEVMAERAFISRWTLKRVEEGDPGVKMGNYAAVLGVLGFAEALGKLADQGADRQGLELAEEQLPQRIRSGGRKRKEADDGA